MARFPTRQKIHRVVDFMLGMRHPRVVVAMRARGYTEQHHQRGLVLLARALEGRFDIDGLRDPNPFATFRAWRDEWYPCAKSVISLLFPAHDEPVFRNLVFDRNDESIALVVETLVTRLDALPAEVRSVLAERGLNSEVLEEARQLVREFRTFAQGSEPYVAHDVEAATIGALWLWYRDWSSMARQTITDRRLLRALGFHKATAEDEPEPESER